MSRLLMCHWLTPVVWPSPESAQEGLHDGVDAEGNDSLGSLMTAMVCPLAPSDSQSSTGKVHLPQSLIPRGASLGLEVQEE